jgi:alpha-glucoside transport system substrate-binding protein
MTPQQAALAAAGGQKIGGTVTFLGPWGGTEQDAFMAMVKPFEDATGIQVQYTGSRDEPTILVTRVQAGNPPDLADFSTPGQLAQFAQQGKLVDLSTVLDMNTINQQYAKTWLDLGTVNGKLVGMFVKVATKGLIWYDPKVWQADGYQIPATWDDMIALSDKIASSGNTPWCVALESGAASGWPGTDWLEDIVLRQDGAQFYQQWYQGKIAWTSPEIKKAFQTWGQIVANPKMVYGGVNSMLTTNFGNVGDPLFTNPPGCYMAHQASFISSFFTTNNKTIQPVTDFNFFPFPPFTANAPVSTEMAGDVVGMFNNTPQAQALMRYLSTPEAQDIWAKIGGGYLSANKNVPISDYPDELTQKSANILVNAQVAVFDASDSMPTAMTNAFYTAILDYVQNPGNLDSILQHLDSIRQTAYTQ